MIGFGENNEEFGTTLPPYLTSCEEIISDDENSSSNALLIKIVAETGINLQIEFNSYIMHLTRNESYTVWDDYEIRKGKYLVTFEKSRLLDFCDIAIVHTEDYSFPGKLTHYGVYTCDHIIDIIADSTPIITRI